MPFFRGKASFFYFYEKKSKNTKKNKAKKQKENKEGLEPREVALWATSPDS